MSAGAESQSPSLADGAAEAMESDTVFYDTLEEVNSSDTEAGSYDSEVFNSPMRSRSSQGMYDAEFWKNSSYESSKKSHGYLSRLSDRFHRQSKTLDDPLSASDGFLTPYFRAARSLTPPVISSSSRRTSTPLVSSESGRLHSKRKYAEHSALKRRSAIDPMPVSIFISGAVDEGEPSSGGLKSCSRFYGSTGNLLDMTDGREKTNLTKRHLGKSLQLVSDTLVTCINVLGE